MKLASLAFVLLAALPIAAVGPDADRPKLPDGSRLLWNGDTDETSQIVQLGEVVEGGVEGKCLAASWPRPPSRINPVIVFGKRRPNVELKGFAELWFYVKASAGGKTFAVELKQWTGRAARVEIDPYLTKGGLTTEWQLVRIPLADFQANDTWQGQVDHIIFNAVHRKLNTTRQDRDLLPQKLYVDEMYLVPSPK